MEISETGGPDDRIAALEKKTEEMEALVKGLMAEMLDIKAIAMKRAQQGGEQNRQQHAREPTVVGNPAHGAGETLPHPHLLQHPRSTQQ